MVHFSGSRPKRSPLQKFLRIVAAALILAAAFLALYNIPYDVLRQERVRLYGERRTSGLVLETFTDTGAPSPGDRYGIKYKYVDPDGYAHTAVARLALDDWRQYRPGSPVPVYYAVSWTDLSRIPGEIEPHFQTWLREALN